MKTGAAILGVGLVCASAVGVRAEEPRAASDAAAPSVEAPGVVERAALAKVEFLVGDWEGEGWSISRAGERSRFWVREAFHYRGDRDLMDMEGIFGDILQDGTRTPSLEYNLGILFFDRGTGDYRMWHYSSSGEVFTTPMVVDVAGREMHYTREYPSGAIGRFHLVVGADGVWTTRLHVQQDDGSWRQVMEFRMQRTDLPPESGT